MQASDADRDRVLRYNPDDLSADPISIPVDDDQIADEAPRSLAEGSGAAEGVWVVNELGETIVRIAPEKNEVASTFQVDAPTAVAADDSGIWRQDDPDSSRFGIRWSEIYEVHGGKLEALTSLSDSPWASGSKRPCSPSSSWPSRPCSRARTRASRTSTPSSPGQLAPSV